MLTDPDRYAIEYICLHLRACDRREIFTMRPHDNPVRLAHEAWWMITTQGRGVVAWHKGRPAAVLALVENWHGVWDAIAFGTDDWKSVAIEMVRWARKNIAQVIEEMDGHRLQAASHVESVESHKFLTVLGAEPEAVLRGYGKDGSDYIQFAWVKKTKEDWSHVLRWRGQQQGGDQAELDEPGQGGLSRVCGTGRRGQGQGLPRLAADAQRYVHQAGEPGPRVLAADGADSDRWLIETLRGQ